MALPDYNEPWYGEEFRFVIHLTSQANTKIFQVNPTLAAGDCKIQTQLNGAWGTRGNITTLPVVVHTSGSGVEVVVSAAEMTSDQVNIELADAAGSEWCAYSITIRPRKPVGATMLRTTIATLASQTSFTLTTGSADNDAYNGLPIVVEDASTLVQRCVGVVSDYVGSTKTVTLLADPSVFTMAVGDRVFIMASDQRLRYIGSASAAKVSGANTATNTFTDMDGTTTRITATVDADGNRTAITYG